MKMTAPRIAAMAICLTVTVGIAVDGRTDDLMEFSTRELESHLRKTSEEVRTMKNLERKLESAARQSSNTARKSSIDNLQEHMIECILRREDDLGQEHTIKMHGEEVTTGTTSAAEVGSAVGTKSAGTSLNYKEGIAGLRLRQLSRMQSIFVSAKTIVVPATEKQGGSLERYTDLVRQFREELERSEGILESELEKRAQAEAAEKEAQKEAEEGN